jgi:hypothetical protein
MNVYVVIEEVTYHYDDGRVYRNIYGVYRNERAADAAVAECEAQVGGSYYAIKEQHFVE